MNTMTSTHLPRAGAVLFALAVLPCAAMAQQAQTPSAAPAAATKAAPAQKKPTASRYGKTGQSIQHGTDVAGRGVAHADDVARRGIDKGSEAASRPVRNLGDSLGRKLGLGPAPSGAPARGPQSEAP